MEIGLVGKPNSGKTTFFNAATLLNAPVADYPFTTIEANIGVTYIRRPCPCRELNVKCNPQNSMCINGTRFIPVRIIDVAGLVEGAHEGRGLGNKFLDDLRMAAALLHIVDASGSTDKEGRVCEPGSHDPLEDVKFLENEIRMWIKGILAKDWKSFARRTKYQRLDLAKEIARIMTGLGITEEQVIEAIKKAGVDRGDPEKWSDEDLLSFAGELQKVSKPMIIVANKCDVPTAEKNIERLKHAGYLTVPASAEAELILRRAAEKDIISYQPGDPSFIIKHPEKLTDLQKSALERVKKLMEKFGGTGVQQAIEIAVRDLLELIVVYPVSDENKFADKNGNVLPDAFLVRRGTTVREFAYKIHTDLGETFLYAVDAKTKRRIGEDYELKEGDVIKIVATKGL
ncbi:MAG: redox-regulated ATPase YchF [Candidatus Hadarchaeales archaeon]